jgi:uncharacterized protein with HEPN domain
MRPEELYLSDIMEAVEAIERFLEGIHRDAFLGDAPAYELPAGG